MYMGEESEEQIKQKYGNLKIVWHHEKLNDLLNKKITAPISVRLKPTNKCNHKCFFCSYAPEFEYVLSEKLKRNDEIPKEKIIEILDNFKEMGVKTVTYSGGGEPLIYPHIVDALKKTIENGIELSIITNGQWLDGERAELLTGARWVRISIDACNAKTFSESRHVPESFFDKLVENIRQFAKNKKSGCELGINFVVHEKNCDEVYASAVLFKELGANHIKFTPLYTPRNFETYHTPFKEKVIAQIKKAKKDIQDSKFAIYDTYENDFNLGSKNRRCYKKCYIMQTVPVIGADCEVYFCHDKAYSSDGSLGSIKTKSFKDLWFSEETANIFENFNPIEGCPHHCTYDARNIFLTEAINCFGEHVNFI